MTKWRFSSKSQSSTEDVPPEEVKKISGTLALRVLLVCLALIVVPLFLHSFFLFRQEVHLKSRDLFLILEMTAKEKERALEFLIKSQLSNLQMMGTLLDWQNLEGMSRDQLDQIAAQQQLDSLFFQKLEAGSGFACVYSVQPELLGKTDLFSQAMQQALKKGQAVFLSQDPVSQNKQIYISQLITEAGQKTPIGILTLGLSAQKIVNELVFVSKQTPYHFDLSLIAEKGEFFISTDSHMTSKQVSLLSASKPSSIDIVNEMNAEQEEIHFLPFHKGTRQLLGVKIPVKGTNFSLLIDVAEKQVLEIFHREIYSSFSTLLVLIIVIGGGTTVWLTLRMSRPSKALNALMEQVAKGDFSGRYQTDRLGFEVNVLGEHFNRMIESLLKKMEEVKRERLAKEVLTQELNIGREIQRSILPKEVPEIPGLEIATGFWPAKEVAGDFYDLFVKKEGEQLLLSVADAAGKGVSACLYSLLMRSMLRSYAADTDDLSEILTKANHLFCQDTGDTGFFVTAWVGLYDAKKRLLHYLCCGHHPAILVRQNGAIIELETPGIALGVVELENISCAQVQLEPGDLLILYTDGIIEAHDPANQMFGRKRLFEVIEKEGREPPSFFLKKLVDEISAFTKGTPLHDDLTIVAIKVL